MLNTEDLKCVLKEHVREWNTVQNEDIIFTRLSGLTNIVYRVTHLKGLLDPVILRKFGNVEGLIERDKENIIFKYIGNHGLGPRLLFVNDGCRIEQFLKQGQHPTNTQLKSTELKKHIVRRMADYHQIVIPELHEQQNFVDYFLSPKFASVCEKRLAEHTYAGDRLAIYQSVSRYLSKLLEIRGVLCTMQKSTVRLCHNDLNNLNMMLIAGTNDVRFIDLEYSRSNYLAYDLANFLNECAFNYSVKEPPFFEYKIELVTNDQEIRQISQTYLEQQAMRTGRPFTLQDLEQLTRDIYNCIGLCNLYWAVWSILSDSSTVKFDYFEHARKRIEIFERIFENVKQRRLEKP